MVRPQHEKILDFLYLILLEHPKGLSEYQLLEILKNKGITDFLEPELSDPLILFRTHFLLFYFLYSLRDRLLLSQKGDIEIHCLNICLQPWTTFATTLPGKHDPLRAYYLDWEQLETVTREDVKNLLQSFWKEFNKYTHKDEALKVFDLQSTASQKTIKKRYRELMFQHHPDYGGDPEHFIKIKDAAEILIE